MVRHKTRWLLVRVDFEPDIIYGTQRPRDATNETSFYGGRRDTEARRTAIDTITKKDLYKCIRESLLSTFGVSASGAAQNIQVRLYDVKSRLAMIRVPREFCDIVRVAITFIVSLENIPVVASCISVNGCARTAKMVIVRELRKNFRGEVGSPIGGGTKTLKQVQKDCTDFEERMSSIRNID